MKVREIIRWGRTLHPFSRYHPQTLRWATKPLFTGLVTFFPPFSSCALMTATPTRSLALLSTARFACGHWSGAAPTPCTIISLSAALVGLLRIRRHGIRKSFERAATIFRQSDSSTDILLWRVLLAWEWGAHQSPLRLHELTPTIFKVGDVHGVRDVGTIYV
ncbi:MAG: hypothetical protein RL518_258 [Pseudomonadota bacterium]